MRFTELFAQCKEQLKKELKEMWLEERKLWPTGVTTLADYESQIDRLLEGCFKGDNILVEDMGEWKGADGFPDDLLPKSYWREWPNKNKEEASLCNRQIQLEDKPYNPFLHQVESWRKLLEEEKTICVTTGTGSGKTECFMVPLVKDLADNYNPQLPNQPVQALFLYPLNALMDDQRTRMSECIECSGVDLKFAVYNGNTPEDVDDENYQIVEGDRRKHELIHREEIRNGNHPNILFTNPTMLEYLLLRRADNDLLEHSQGKLRWIVIDETHTFSGAAAAELALLVRRVVDAFGTDIRNIRFATSSATVGDSELELRKFISGITGKPLDQICVVRGNRSRQRKNDTAYFDDLHEQGFLTLDQMVGSEGNVNAKLERLDALCESGLKVKLHLFAKALNRGLFVDLLGNPDRPGQFKLMDGIDVDPNTGQYKKSVVSAKYCSCCGSVFASAELVDNRFARPVVNTSSIFDQVTEADLEDDDADDGQSDNSDLTHENSQDIEKHSVLLTYKEKAVEMLEKFNRESELINVDVDEEMNVIEGGDRYCYYDDDGSCPLCGAGSKNQPIRQFNVAADKVSGLLTPILLQQANPVGDPNGKLFDGRQMISFADSRNKAAKPSLRLNKQVEKDWVTWTVYQKINHLRTDLDDARDLLNFRMAQYENNPNEKHRRNLDEAQKDYDNLNQGRLTWMDALETLLGEDDESRYRCRCFAKQFAGKDDLYGGTDAEHEEGTCKPEYLRKYVLSALYELFKARPRKGRTPESCGQIKVVYPRLDEITCLPKVVEEFNALVRNEDDKIGLDDWKDYLSIYLDYRARSNGALFFVNNDANWNYLDINSCRNLRTTNGVRRTMSKIPLGDNKMTLLLCSLLGRNVVSELNRDEKQVVQNVLDKAWEILFGELHIIVRGKVIGDDGSWKDDSIRPKIAEDEQGRLNVVEMAFEIPSEIWYCPATNRYLTRKFKQYSPYNKVNCSAYNVVAVPADRQIVEEPKLFLQSEHTAQLGRLLTKSRIKDFKDHKINILACSTTMEMGVDLGSVELVEMTNIPPHPANYKQRAGRAGRRGQNRSACLTICGSDGIDACFFNSPKENVTRTIAPPTVGLNSKQVVQRHVNSLLFKQWLQTENANVCLGGNNKTKVIDFFTSYSWYMNAEGVIDTTNVRVSSQRVRPMEVSEFNSGRGIVDPSIGYCFDDNLSSGVGLFLEYLDRYDATKPDYSSLPKKIGNLVKGTVFENIDTRVLIGNARDAIVKVWNELDSYFCNLRKKGERNCYYYRHKINGFADACSSCSHLQECDGVNLDRFDCQCAVDDDTASKLKERFKKSIVACNYDFTSRLKEPLLTYLSTHQFLPNANMPVNVVELRISDTKDYKGKKNSENPTYDLATALGQWAPGNYITIKDATYQIGGVERDYSQSWKKIRKCSTCGHTWISEEVSCPLCGSSDLLYWNVNGSTELKLVEPIAFIPTTDRSRITDNNANHTMAKAELIGASKMERPTQGWFAHRVSDSDDKTSMILIYNDGVGYGYRICKKCGKAQLECGTPNNEDPREIINSFYDQEAKDGNEIRYHKDLLGYNKPCFCNVKYDPFKDVYRNIIIGGLIQTDYCEICLFEREGVALRPIRDDDKKKIRVTLGVLMCRYMVEQGVCERNDIDFILTGKHSLCIFDKAKGGAGYSKQLTSEFIKDGFDYCRNKLSTTPSLFTIIDSASQRYIEEIEIDATLQWLVGEHDNREEVPQSIKEIIGDDVRGASWHDIEQLMR
ncbi:MAG: DEAD/DEAH box helicase [Bacteroidales bacterium]|nr:DEAD/DEAH box helicase [Bacteroidales bacterium]